jgi:hypothetical protein
VILVRFEACSHLGAVAFEASGASKSEQLYVAALADLILEAGVDRLTFLGVDQLYQRSESTAANEFQHRRRDVLPPVVGLDLLDQRPVVAHHRDAGLLYAELRRVRSISRVGVLARSRLCVAVKSEVSMRAGGLVGIRDPRSAPGVLPGRG